MEPGLEVMIFMGIILKIPVALACWIIYWAWKAAPEPAEASDEDGGHRFHRFRRQPKRPKGPRRGPHAPDALPLPCPQEGTLRVDRRPATGHPLTASGREQHR